MRVSIRPTEESVERAEKVWLFFTTLPNMLMPEAFDLAFAEWGSAVNKIFDEEGPGWGELADWTVSDRTRLGYTSEHPILHRQGFLQDSLTKYTGPKDGFVKMLGGEGEEGEPWPRTISTGNQVDVTTPESGMTVIRFATLDERFTELQEGRPNMPARDMLPDGAASAELNTAIGKALAGLVQTLASQML